MNRKNSAGFTLVELVVVLAILALLAALAYPTYMQFLRKGRRGEGISTLVAIQLSQEKYRANNSTYGTLAQAWGLTATENGYYNLALTGTPTSTAFTVTATAVGDQANDKTGATACSTLTLAVNGPNVTKTPTACWAK